jgi:hypothetical protein
MQSPVDATTLIVIPCCAAKATGGANLALQDPLGASLSEAAYAQLCHARRSVLSGIRNSPDLLTDAFSKNRALVEGPDFASDANSGRYLPALERYTGNLYAVPGLRTKLYASLSDDNAPRVLILSALYGPLHLLSQIQDYNLRMDQAPARIWQKAYLPLLEHYVSTQGIRSIVLLVGSMTAYYRVASQAAFDLLRRGRIATASQYHVLDGNTRATPIEHGRILLDLLSGQRPSSTRIERRDVGGRASALPYRPSPVVTGAPMRLANTVPLSKAPETHPAPRMQRAPRPNASPSEIAHTKARNVHNAADNVPRDGNSSTKLPVVTSPHIIQPPVSTPTTFSLPALTSAALQAQKLPGISADRSRFDELLRRLMTGVDQGLPLARLLEIGRLPDRGVYFFLDSATPNTQEQWHICRVGTHAVSLGSKSTLRARLQAHLGTRTGSGNHRGSIFRLHVGNALLQRDQRDIATWGKGSVAPHELRTNPALREAEAQHEKQVSDYMAQLPVLWLAVPDEASPASERSIIERNAIALLSRDAQLSAAHPNGWLGEHSPRREIRGSRLWNLNYVDDEYNPSFLALLERSVGYTLASQSGS